MNPPDACPDPSRLRDLLSGTLDEAAESALAEHLDGCPACRALVDRWSASADPLGGLTPASGPRRSPALDQILDVIKAAPPEPGRDPERRGVSASAETLLQGDEDPVPGRFGAYELVERVGRGGMGVVFKAIDPALNRVVAIKRLSPELAASPLARRRFLREARAAAAVCHEHVVTIHAVDEAEGLPYLVMPYVAGRSLQEKIDLAGPLGLKEMLRIGMQVASGLAAAHAQGLVHRDIKPANILLENGVERAKITDFGLAVAASDVRLTRDGAIAGTPQFMAPEQARGGPVDPRTDLFSLGSVLYAMATGEAPFDGDSVVAVLRKVSDEAPPPVRSRNPAVPPWLADVIGRLMAKDAAARFQTAAEVAELLGRRLAEIQLPQADPPAPPAAAESMGTAGRGSGERGGRKGRRLALAALAASSAIGLASLAAWLATRRPEAPTRRQTHAVAPPAWAPAPASTEAKEEAMAVVELGHKEANAGRHREAIAHFSEALRLDPGCVPALVGRGISSLRSKDPARALADLDEAIRLDPRNVDAYTGRASVEGETGAFDRALADAEEAVRLAPGDSWAHYHRGFALNGLRHWGRAIEAFDASIRLSPNVPWAYFHRAMAYRQKGALDPALADLDRAVALEPAAPHFRAHRALAFAAKRDWEHALADADEAVRLAPDNPYFHRDRAEVYALEGDWKRAAAEYDCVIALGLENTETYRARAEARDAIGDAEGARADRKEERRLRGGTPAGAAAPREPGGGAARTPDAPPRSQ